MKKRVLIGLLSAGLLVAALPASMALAAPADKVIVCHQPDGNDLMPIEISGNAVRAHLDHGDPYLVGDVVGGRTVQADCTLGSLPTVTICSANLNFGPTGWGGWSCPTNYTIVSVTYENVGTGEGDLAATYLWNAGASAGGATYPNTPFGYTYTPPEEGAIAQNDNDAGETIVLILECLPTS